MLGPEAQEQKKIFEWAKWAEKRHPELEMLFAIPNGGSRNKIEAINLKRQGLKAGVPDFTLQVPKGNYHGLYIELKVGKNKPSEKQKKWIDNLNKYGYKALVCYGFDEAVKEIIEYLGIGR